MKQLRNLLMLMAMISALAVTTEKAQAQGGPGGRGGFGDPAQMKQNILDNLKTELSVTNDEEWKVLEGAIGKVVDAGMENRGSGMNVFRLLGRGTNRRGGDNGGEAGNNNRRRMGPPAAPEEEDLKKAIDDSASTTEDIKAKMAKLREVRADKEAKLTAAQEDLKKIVTSKQEAVLVYYGILK